MTNERIEHFVNDLRSTNWIVVTKSEHTVNLASSILSRYPNIPASYLNFLGHIAECTNSRQNVWFLTEADYNADGKDDSVFRWNEWERLSIDASGDDTAAIQEVKNFWDVHIPIMMSTKSDYAYIAISLNPNDFGAVYYGYEPEFEDTKKVCESFDEWLDLFQNIIMGRSSFNYYDDNGSICVRREVIDFV